MMMRTLLFLVRLLALGTRYLVLGNRWIPWGALMVVLSLLESSRPRPRHFVYDPLFVSMTF